jgi:hypothetical protein
MTTGHNLNSVETSMCYSSPTLKTVKSGWRVPVAQGGTFTPERRVDALEVEWDYSPSEGVGIVNVKVNGRSIRQHLKDSDIEALADEAKGHVEGGVL